MLRRTFLKGIIGACAAPAVVKADSLMNIWVPSTEIIRPKRVEVMITQHNPGNNKRYRWVNEDRVQMFAKAGYHLEDVKRNVGPCDAHLMSIDESAKDIVC